MSTALGKLESTDPGYSEFISSHGETIEHFKKSCNGKAAEFIASYTSPLESKEQVKAARKIFLQQSLRLFKDLAGDDRLFIPGACAATIKSIAILQFNQMINI